jgi:hypothetical protein
MGRTNGILSDKLVFFNNPWSDNKSSVTKNKLDPMGLYMTHDMLSKSIILF